MSTKAALLRFRSDTVANLRTVNKFALGEPVYATDAKIFKIGDGTHGWDELKEFGAAAEHYVRTGTATGSGTQTMVIDVGEEDIKEISFELAATGAFTAPYGGLLSGTYSFKTGSTLLNYVGQSTDDQTLIVGSWRDTHFEASKQLINGHWYVTLHGVTSASAEAEGYAKFYNGLPYRWHAVPLAGDGGGSGGDGYYNYFTTEITPSSATKLTVSGIGFLPKRAFLIKKTGQGTPINMEPLSIYYYDDISQQPSGIDPGEAYVMYMNSNAWRSSTINAAATFGQLELTISNALVFNTSSNYVFWCYG